MAELIETKKRNVLSCSLVIFGWLAMLIFAFHASTRMVGAGDTWVAMACGRHFLDQGVDTVEPFSANSHKAGPTEKEIKRWPNWAQWITDKVGLETVKYWHPTGWVNQNWLTHVIFYWLTHKSPFADAQTFSFNTLVYWKFALYILTVICVYYTARLLGAHPALCAAFSCFAMFVGRSFFDIRPAGFSNLLVAVFLLILVLATYRNILYIWLIVPVAVFWCNAHGGYVYLFIMLVPFVALNFLTCISKKWFVSIGLKGIYHTIGAGAAAFIAVIIFNPFHLTNLTHTFIISVSKHAEMWRTVNEWHPAFSWTNPVGSGFPFLVLLILNIGLLLLWLASRLLKPRLLKAPRNELEAQKKFFDLFSWIFGYAAAVLICWATFISFSFTKADPASFFICALLVGILFLSIYKSVHFIYLALLLILFTLWATDAKGYAGRYIYPFVLIPSYVTLYIFASLFSKNIKFKLRNIIIVSATSVAALLLMIVIFNPFKFEPLLNVKQFLQLKRIWRPPYERNLPITYRHLFSSLYITNIISVIIWLAFPYLKDLFKQLPGKTGQEQQAFSFQLPKIDLALLAIAALTVYMAIRSRRFIPIAAIASCPVIAMFTDHITRTISASRNFYRQNRLTVPPLPSSLQWFFTLAAAVAVLAFGVWWTLKFKYVYLDFWPADPKLNSVFMRMTASDVKPFYACNFIKENKLKGKMFNYWTEGGFIAWGQEPDPNTGKTPLQLFMDGRAQAAYEPRGYQVWADIMAGGQKPQIAKMRKQKLTTSDYIEIGQWIDKKLKGSKVWVVLMPRVQFDKDFVKGLEYNPNWPLVYLDNEQKLFVDVTTPQGKELITGIFNGKTLYPDEFSKNLILAHHMFLIANNKNAPNKQRLDSATKGLDFAIKAFELDPSQKPMEKIIFASRFQGLKPRVDEFCNNYMADFTKNKSQYSKQSGYHTRAVAAALAMNYLQRIAEKEKNTELIQSYKTAKEEYNEEIKRLVKTKRW
ncbi:MAG: hypothetical protein ACYS0I_03010 [Planctomycetota bacterium]|jgi:hypothetical protein